MIVCLVALSNIVQLVCCSLHLLRSEKKLSQMCPAFTIENSPPLPPLPYNLSKIFSLTFLKWLVIFSAQIWMHSQECFNCIRFSADDELPCSEEKILQCYLDLSVQSFFAFTNLHVLLCSPASSHQRTVLLSCYSSNGIHNIAIFCIGWSMICYFCEVGVQTCATLKSCGVVLLPKTPSCSAIAALYCLPRYTVLSLKAIGFFSLPSTLELLKISSYFRCKAEECEVICSKSCSKSVAEWGRGWPRVPDLQNTFGVQGVIFLISSTVPVLGNSMSQLHTSLLN